MDLVLHLVEGMTSLDALTRGITGFEEKRRRQPLNSPPVIDSYWKRREEEGLLE